MLNVQCGAEGLGRGFGMGVIQNAYPRIACSSHGKTKNEKTYEPHQQTTATKQ